MSCPNSDPAFDKIFKKMHSSYSPEIDYPTFRKKVYYGVCIWVRLILFTIILYYKDKKWMPYVVGLLSIVSIVNLYPNRDNKQQWWSKKFDLVVSIMILISCVMILVKNTRVPTVVVPMLLYMTLLGGIIQSKFITFC